MGNIILIQGLITLMGILLTALLTYYFSQKKYTYEKLFDRKLVYLEKIYGKIVSLEKDLKKYIITIASNMDKEFLLKKKEEISLIKTKFFELQEYFWKKEIVLDESSVTAIQSFVDASVIILSNLQASVISQQTYDPQTSRVQWNEAFQIMNNKLAEAKEQLKSDFKKAIKTDSLFQWAKIQWAKTKKFLSTF